VVHGALWIALKTEGELELRARRTAARAWWGLAALVILITLVSFRIQPHLQASFEARPWGAVFPALAVAGLVGARLMNGRLRELGAFLCSCLFILGMLTSVAFGVYPYVLPSNSDPALSLTVSNTAAPLYGLKVGLVWFIPGMLLATGYFVYTYRSFSGKVK
jgi:cytochrome d ubiquinol oxidase subunit II